MPDKSTRDVLVRAGVELLERGGSADIGLREIARHAGVSHGAPRRWFPTHKALLSAIAAVGLRDFSAAVVGAAGTATGREAITRATRAYVDFAVDRPAMFTLIFRHDLLDGGGADLRGISQPLIDWFRDRLDIADQAERELTAAALWTGVHGTAVLTTTGAFALASPRTPPYAVLDAAIEVAFDRPSRD